MKAAVFHEVGVPLSIETVADPAPEAGEAIVRVEYCGVCGTDLHLTEHHGIAAPGTVLGHEYAGEIVALGRDVQPGWAEGDRLCTLPFLGCGHCLPCAQGRPWRCATKQIVGVQVPGGFAEYVRVHLPEAVRLPEAIDWQEGALVEPMAVALHGVRKIANMPARNVLVVGAGPIGLAATLWCRFFGARHVVVSEFDPGRRAMAERLGATATLDAAGDVAAAFADIAGGAPDLIVECVGVPGVVASCYALAEYGAEILVLGYCVSPDTVIPTVALDKELSVRFSIAYDKSDFQFVVDMIASRRIDVRPLITDVLDFDAFPAAFEALRRPQQQCKILLRPTA